MVDLETMASSPRAAVASLGAVAFDPDGDDTVTSLLDLRRRFYVNLDLRDQPNRQFDGDTIYWWLSQPPATQQAILMTENRLKVGEALVRFSDWCHTWAAQRAWCLGATFDHVIIEDLYRSLKRRNPIRYSNQLCARTIAKVADLERPELPELVAHNALDDCVKQVIWLQQCFKKLRNPTTVVNVELDGQKIAEQIVNNIRERVNEQPGDSSQR
jgi:hypothetical protein